MTDERLNSMAILNIESEITKSLQYDNIINEYSSFKTRKKKYVNCKYCFVIIIIAADWPTGIPAKFPVGR
jgi:hypothetical protein